MKESELERAERMATDFSRVEPSEREMIANSNRYYIRKTFAQEDIEKGRDEFPTAEDGEEPEIDSRERRALEAIAENTAYNHPDKRKKLLAQRKKEKEALGEEYDEDNDNDQGPSSKPAPDDDKSNNDDYEPPA